jgi:hypothetical protein
MKRFLFLFLVCCTTNVLGETNSASVAQQLFSIPEMELRLSNSESNLSAAQISRLPWPSEQREAPISSEDQGATNALAQGLFEATSLGGGLSRVSMQIYDRLDKAGFMTKPELPSENRVDQLVNSIFVPEVIKFRKMSVSCSVITAIKRKNPLALINPIFLNVRW